jgi:hypothetical protein
LVIERQSVGLGHEGWIAGEGVAGREQTGLGAQAHRRPDTGLETVIEQQQRP